MSIARTAAPPRVPVARVWRDTPRAPPLARGRETRPRAAAHFSPRAASAVLVAPRGARAGNRVSIVGCRLHREPREWATRTAHSARSPIREWVTRAAHTAHASCARAPCTRAPRARPSRAPLARTPRDDGVPLDDLTSPSAACCSAARTTRSSRRTGSGSPSRSLSATRPAASPRGSRPRRASAARTAGASCARACQARPRSGSRSRSRRCSGSSSRCRRASRARRGRVVVFVVVARRARESHGPPHASRGCHRLSAGRQPPPRARTR